VIEMLRVSSDRQDVERQEYDVAENREKFDLNVLRTIRLKISGTLAMTDPEVQQMIADLAQPGVDAVSISAIDRLFRPRDYKSVAIYEFFADNGKAIISTKEGLVEPGRLVESARRAPGYFGGYPAQVCVVDKPIVIADVDENGEPDLEVLETDKYLELWRRAKAAYEDEDAHGDIVEMLWEEGYPEECRYGSETEETR
jgi:hypothetical protein